MWKTALLLIVTIIVIPFISFRFDVPLTELQRAVLMDLITVYLVFAALAFVVSSITNNHSQVDKLWSVLPVVYGWIMAYQSGFEPRIVLMALMITAWGLRLSYNFSRRGGYSVKIWKGEEDYRWSILQAKPEFAAKWKWMLFNLFFISYYQMGLILLMTLPALRSIGGKPLTWWDIIIAGLMLFFIVTETIADQQQWNYHRQKNHLRNQGGELPHPYSKGFVDTGLWGLARHPNYASEQAIWIVFYFFSVSASGQWLNWSVTGAILLVLLFWGSSNFSESVSAGKYPDYDEYRKRVPRFIPVRFSSFKKEN
jgi:steroid 5-alpha reductase family enzyme